MGLQDPVGKKVSMGHLDGKIIGVMEDYNYASLQHEITPLLMTVYHEKFNKNYFSIKIASGDFSEVIDYVKTTMEDIDPNYNIDYYFLDNYFDRLYKTEERSTVLITFATIYGYQTYQRNRHPESDGGLTRKNCKIAFGEYDQMDCDCCHNRISPDLLCNERMVAGICL